MARCATGLQWAVVSKLARPSLCTRSAAIYQCLILLLLSLAMTALLCHAPALFLLFFHISLVIEMQQDCSIAFVTCEPNDVSIWFKQQLLFCSGGVLWFDLLIAKVMFV